MSSMISLRCASAMMLRVPLDEALPMPSVRSMLGKAVRRYQEISAKQTTDVSRREERQQKFIEAIDLL